MVARDKALKRQRRTDRLSSLTDDILIDILSHLPLRFAVSTGCLSQRWRGLWTNLTNIDMSNCKFKGFSEFLIFFDSILMKIVSPSIYRFSVDLGYLVASSYCYNDSWLRQLHDRNVRELNITWPEFRELIAISFPRFIFQTQSLESVEMHLKIGWDDDSDHPFNLPNLKNLSVSFSFYSFTAVEKLIHDCPSLEKLSVTCCDDYDCWFYGVSTFRCSNQNLRRLILNLETRLKVAINTPKLEYLAIRAPKSTTFCFDEKPLMLHEAKIETIDYDRGASRGEDGLISNFYGVISTVKVLTIDVSALNYMCKCNGICNATRIKLNIKLSHSMKIVSSLLELCPLAEILTLQFQDISKHQLLPKATNVSTLRHSPKRLEIEVCWPTHCQPAESFLKFVKYLLSKATSLECFRFTVVAGRLWTSK